MGFCDVAPGEKKQLRILFAWQNRIYDTLLGDEVNHLHHQERMMWTHDVAALIVRAAVFGLAFTTATSGLTKPSNEAVQNH